MFEICCHRFSCMLQEMICVGKQDRSFQLFRSLTANHYNCLEYWVSKGADVNRRPSEIADVSLLMFAAMFGDIRALKILLKGRAIVNYQDDIGTSALLHAVRQGSSQCVDLLIKAGANVNITDRFRHHIPISEIPLWCDDDAYIIEILGRAGPYVNNQTV